MLCFTLEWSASKRPLLASCRGCGLGPQGRTRLSSCSRASGRGGVLDGGISPGLGDGR